MSEEKVTEIMAESREEPPTESKEKGELEKINKIAMPKDQAKEEWKKYCDLLKTRQEKFLKVMKESMHHIKEGRNLIDVYEAMKNAGLNEKQEPKLAICRADVRECFFEKRDTGTGIFGHSLKWSEVERTKDLIELPQNTFGLQWLRQQKNTWNIEKKILRTKVPVIPVELMPEGKLENYYILWEVKEWQDMPEAKKDPFLLKRISENLFAILGAWEVTELERAVMRGLR
jgi:hypothetical protein